MVALYKRITIGAANSSSRGKISSRLWGKIPKSLHHSPPLSFIGEGPEEVST